MESTRFDLEEPKPVAYLRETALEKMNAIYATRTNGVLQLWLSFSSSLLLLSSSLFLDECIRWVRNEVGWQITMSLPCHIFCRVIVLPDEQWWKRWDQMEVSNQQLISDPSSVRCGAASSTVLTALNRFRVGAGPCRSRLYKWSHAASGWYCRGMLVKRIDS